MESKTSLIELGILADLVDRPFDPPLIVREIQRKLDEAIEQHRRELARQPRKKRVSRKQLT
jgi:hypothetical protein